MPSNHLILCHALLLLPSIFPSLRVFFQRVGCSYQVAKILELQLQHQPFQWVFRVISISIDWFDLLLQFKELSSLLQHHHLKASIVYGPALTITRDYWKDHSLTLRTFVGKVMSLHFNALSRFVIASLPRSNQLLISWLQSPSAAILEPKKGLRLRGNPPLFPLFPFYLPWNHEARCHDLRGLFPFYNI